MYKKFISIPLLLGLLSCSTVVRNVFGNQLIDSHYAPKKQINTFYTEIPYKIEKGRIMIKAKINNSEKEYNFMFDTGAITIISDVLVPELGLKDGVTVVNRDTFNNETVGVSYLTSLKIGSLDIKNLRINTATTDLFSKKCSQNIDGIIGPNILNQGFYYFNARERILVITNIKEKLPLNKFGKSTRLKRFLGQPYLKIKGANKVWLKLDTGYANGFLLVNENSKIVSRKDKQLKQKKMSFKGLFSEEIKTVSYYEREVFIGQNAFLNTIEQYSNKNCNGYIGSKIIEDNDIVIDVPNKRFYLLKVYDTKIDNNIANINFRFKKDKVIIGALSKGGALEDKGITMNDTVYKINNISIEEIKDECELEDFKKKYINNIFPLIIEINKNNKFQKFTISKKEFYE